MLWFEQSCKLLSKEGANFWWCTNPPQIPPFGADQVAYLQFLTKFLVKKQIFFKAFVAVF